MNPLLKEIRHNPLLWLLAFVPVVLAAQKLKPEMFATFHIITHADMQYLAVPLSAVVRDGDKTSIWVAQPEHQFVRREVKLGLEQSGYIQILSGVQPGEQVAVEGGLLLGSLAGS